MQATPYTALQPTCCSQASWHAATMAVEGLLSCILLGQHPTSLLVNLDPSCLPATQLSWPSYLTCTGHNDIVTSRMLLHSRTSCQWAHMQSSTPAWPKRQGVKLPLTARCRLLHRPLI